MLYKMLGILLAMFACLCIYLQHPNQQLLIAPLPRLFLYFGSVLGLTALILLIIQLPKLVAICIWFAIMIAVWSFVPLLVLFKKA